jgi:hypothetical protein
MSQLNLDEDIIDGHKSTINEEEKFMIVLKLVHTNIKITVRTPHLENLSALSQYLETQKIHRIQ